MAKTYSQWPSQLTKRVGGNGVGRWLDLTFSFALKNNCNFLICMQKEKFEFVSFRLMHKDSI